MSTPLPPPWPYLLATLVLCAASAAHADYFDIAFGGLQAQSTFAVPATLNTVVSYDAGQPIKAIVLEPIGGAFFLNVYTPMPLLLGFYNAANYTAGSAFQYTLANTMAPGTFAVPIQSMILSLHWINDTYVPEPIDSYSGQVWAMQLSIGDSGVEANSTVARSLNGTMRVHYCADNQTCAICPCYQIVEQWVVQAVVDATCPNGMVNSTCECTQPAYVLNSLGTACVRRVCSPGTYISADNSTCLPCPPFQSSPPGATSASQCFSCHTNQIYVQGECVFCSANFIPTATGSNYTNQTTVCVACPMDAAAVPGDVACTPCNNVSLPNSQGECMIVSCPLGSYVVDRVCEGCPDGTTAPLGAINSSSCVPCVGGTQLGSGSSAGECVSVPCPPFTIYSSASSTCTFNISFAYIAALIVAALLYLIFIIYFYRRQRKLHRLAVEQGRQKRRAAAEQREQEEIIERELAEAARVQRVARERAEAERQARERAAAERQARERAEAERLRAEAERLARERANEERRARERAEEERQARDRAEADRRRAEDEERRRHEARAQEINDIQPTECYPNSDDDEDNGQHQGQHR